MNTRKPKDVTMNYCPSCGSKAAEFYQEHQHVWKIICRTCRHYFILWSKPT